MLRATCTQAADVKQLLAKHGIGCPHSPVVLANHGMHTSGWSVRHSQWLRVALGIATPPCACKDVRGRDNTLWSCVALEKGWGGVWRASTELQEVGSKPRHGATPSRAMGTEQADANTTPTWRAAAAKWEATALVAPSPSTSRGPSEPACTVGVRVINPAGRPRARMHTTRIAHNRGQPLQTCRNHRPASVTTGSEAWRANASRAVGTAAINSESLSACTA